MTTAAIVTSSDGVSAGQRADRSGDALEALLTEEGYEVRRELVPDERDRIADVLRRLADDGVPLVIVTGGTGFGPRDVTPEATRDVITREAPGLAEAMRATGRASTPMADLSRGIVGAVARTLVVNVPGSPRGAVESVEAILGLVPHALELLAGDTEHPDGAPEPSGPTPAADAAAAAHGDEHAHSHDHASGPHGDPACDLAHGIGEVDRDWRLVTLTASPVALQLLHLGRLLGYRTVLVEPDPGRVTDLHRAHADEVVDSVAKAAPDATTDVVATDHDTEHLHDLLVGALDSDARWIGLMGSPRHTPPHIDGLRDAGWSDEDIARIHRPIGLDIGSHTPAEIAVSTLAGLVADRNGRSGGFYDA